MSISSYIRDDLAVRLRNGGIPSSQLTLDSLAERYNVSFSPVRAAVAELIDEGLLQKGPNRRLMACEPPARTEAAAAARPERPVDPSEIIADDLVKLSLEGKPVYLREEATAEKYSVSRSAIRNILHKLAGEGILDHIPRRGWRLRPFRQDDLLAFIDVREALEIKALELAFPRLDEAELQRILELNPLPPKTETRFPVDESMHRYIVEASQNSYIADFFERQGRYFRLLFKWEDSDRAAARDAVVQHREVLTALLDKDLSKARQALSHHIRANHPVLMSTKKESSDATTTELHAEETVQ